MILLLGSKANSTLNYLQGFFENAKYPSAHLDFYDLTQHTKFLTSLDIDGRASIEWTFGSLVFGPSQTKLVVNFLNGSINDYFIDYYPADRDFAKAEFTANLYSTLKLFPNVINPPSFNQLAAARRSLIAQWHTSRRVNRNLSVPRFYFGPGDLVEERFQISPRTIVTNDILNTMTWKKEKQDMPISEFCLAYDRPLGVPVVISMARQLTWANSTAAKASQDFATVLEHALQMAAELGMEMATCLYFYDAEQDRFTFASITPEVSVQYLTTTQQLELAQSLLQGVA